MLLHVKPFSFFLFYSMHVVLNFRLYVVNAGFSLSYVMSCDGYRCDGVSGDTIDTGNYGLHGILFYIYHKTMHSLINCLLCSIFI